MAKEEKPRRLKLLKILVLVYFGFNLVLGLGITACGSWMFASLDVRAYITVFVRSTNDQSLVAAAALLLTAGIFLVISSALAIFAAFSERQKLLLGSMLLMFLVFIFGIVAGFITVALNWNIHKNVKAGMQNQLKYYYEWDSHLGKAWNRVQVKKRCCGADGPWDYENTEWFESNNVADGEVMLYVPDSCCALSFNLDQRLYWVNPQELTLKDPKRCQEDVAGRLSNSGNVHIRGCFSALFRKNPDLHHDVTILTVIKVLQGLGLAAGFLQLISIGLAYFYMLSLKEPPVPREKYQYAAST